MPAIRKSDRFFSVAGVTIQKDLIRCFVLLKKAVMACLPCRMEEVMANVEPKQLETEKTSVTWEDVQLIHEL